MVADESHTFISTVSMCLCYQTPILTPIHIFYTCQIYTHSKEWWRLCTQIGNGTNVINIFRVPKQVSKQLQYFGFAVSFQLQRKHFEVNKSCDMNIALKGSKAEYSSENQ